MAEATPLFIMAYDIKIDTVAFQWKGEKTDAMCQFATLFPNISFKQTQNHILRAHYGDSVVEVPLGNYLIVPERNLLNMLSLNQRIFTLTTKEKGGLQYELFLENVRVLFFQEYTEDSLERILQGIDDKAFVELAKYRFFCSKRLVALTSDKAVIVGRDYAFTWTDEFCRQMSGLNKITYRDKKVVVDDASVVVIKTDATIIVDSSHNCKVYKKDLSGVQDDYAIESFTGDTNVFKSRVETSKWSFPANNSAEANRVIRLFLRENISRIGAVIEVPKTAPKQQQEMANKNLMTILQYIFNTLNMLFKRSSLCKQNQVVTDLRINQFRFRAVYVISEHKIVLVIPE